MADPDPAPAPDPKPAPDPAPAPAPDARAAAPTALDREAKEGDPAPVVPADFPADWREKLAGTDTKALERLKRMPAPGDLWKSYTELDKRLNSGKPQDVPMPDEAKDAEGAKKWREERGIPVDATGYELPKAVQDRLVEEDKPVLENFTSFMHKKNVPPAAVAAAAEWYVDLQETQAAERNAQDKEQADAVEDELRKEWGTDFKANNTVAQRYAKEAIPGVNWFQARLPDGRALGNIPEINKAMAKFGLLEYGDVAFAGGEASAKSQSRLAELKAIMDTDFPRWEAHPELRAEYNKLLAASQKRQPA